jgi:hypothetical protein
MDELFQYFHSLIFSLPLPLPVLPSDRLTNTILFSLPLYICMCTYMHIYDYTYDHIWSMYTFNLHV